MAKPYTPERAYRQSVLPFGVFLIFGGIVFLAASLLMPAEAISVPPLHTPWLKWAAVGGLSFPLLPLGIGFCLRSKVAWRAFFVWLLIGSIWSVVAGMLASDVVAVIMPVAFNLPFAFGIYLATRPAFTSKVQPTPAATQDDELAAGYRLAVASPQTAEANPYRSPETHERLPAPSRYRSRRQAALAGMRRGAVLGAKWMTCILLLFWGLWWVAAAVFAYQWFRAGIPGSTIVDLLEPGDALRGTVLVALITVPVTAVICALLGGLAGAITYRHCQHTNDAVRMEQS